MDIEKLFKDAESSYIKRNFQAALELFMKYQAHKGSNDCMNYIGCCYIEMHKIETAIRIFQDLMDKAPNWERPIFNLGRAYLKKGNNSKAIEYLEKALKINPENEDIYYYLGVYYDRMQDYENAKKYYEKSLAINKEQSETHLNLGMTLFKLDQYELSLSEFCLAYHYDNTCLDAFRNKGLVYLAMKEYQQAIEQFLTFANSEPNDLQNSLDIAYCYYKTRNLDSASQWVNKVIVTESDCHDAIMLKRQIERVKNNSRAT